MLITHNSINLERPSVKSRSIVEQRKKEQLSLSKHDSTILREIKSQMTLDEKDENQAKKKKKKTSQPNPLSMKKKEKETWRESSIERSNKKETT